MVATVSSVASPKLVTRRDRTRPGCVGTGRIALLRCRGALVVQLPREMRNHQAVSSQRQLPRRGLQPPATGAAESGNADLQLAAWSLNVSICSQTAYSR